MKKGNCPKCGGTEIRTNRGNAHQTDHHYLGSVGITGIRCHVYVCTDCGYLEDYVDRDALAKIREKWKTPADAR